MAEGEGEITLPLAEGELEEADAREFAALKTQIQRASGFAMDGYKEKCLRRRLAVRMRARGVHTYSDYAALLDSDPSEYGRFFEVVTINVSKFFRNPEVWAALKRDVVPALFALDVPYVRIWSAGCASGEEPYSMAIVLMEYAEEHGLHEQMERVRITGTDIDEASLAEARRGEYGELSMSETPAAIRERWFEGRRPYRLRREVRRLVRFDLADLISTPFTEGLHLILCRNVIIYLERHLQERLFARFAHALAPEGFLVLGKVESLFGPANNSFRTVANAERIFQLL